ANRRTHGFTVEAAMVSLYKYTSYSAARAIIENHSLKLSRPTAFNDPFDVLLGEALGSDIPHFLGTFKEALIDFVFGEIDPSKIRPGTMGEQIILMNRSVRDKTRSAASLAAMRKAMLKTPIENIWDLDSFEEMVRQ